MEILEVFHSPGAWMALLTLIFLEVVLGIDNIVFLSVMTSKLPERQQPRGRIVGLFLAMLARIGLLFGISLLMRLTHPLFAFHTSWIEGAVSGQGIIVFAGGLFLLYKSVGELHQKFERKKPRDVATARNGFWAIIAQIVLLDVVFSFDSVLTAVGIVSFKDFGYAGAMTIMIAAIVIAVAIMMFFSGAVSRFVNRYPTIQMLALSFLLLIGVMLVVEGAHLSHLVVLGRSVGEIPRGYIYFAIAFSLLVEGLNIRLNKSNKQKTQNRKSPPGTTVG